MSSGKCELSEHAMQQNPFSFLSRPFQCANKTKDKTEGKKRNDSDGRNSRIMKNDENGGTEKKKRG